jgi:2,5-diketo-D-gluconate reductase B
VADPAANGSRAIADGKIERIPQNTGIFDFALTDDDMAAISALKSPGSRIVNPRHLAPDWD